jgi:hypothetical protein
MDSYLKDFRSALIYSKNAISEAIKSRIAEGNRCYIVWDRYVCVDL